MSNFITIKHSLVSDTQRMKYKGVYIQCKKCLKSDNYEAWSSKKPSCDIIGTPGDVYFNFGKTPAEAMEKVKEELDSL